MRGRPTLQVVSRLQFCSSRKASCTENRRRPSKLREDSQGSDILLGQGILHRGKEETGRATDQTCCGAPGDGIFGLVERLLLLGVCHDRVGGRVDGTAFRSWRSVAQQKTAVGG